MATNLLASRYHLLEPIGRGAAAQVYKAMDTRLDRLVAIKLLHDMHASDPDFARRFEHEAKTIAKLSHRHIVDVYDYDEAGGHPFIVMEYVSGPDLKRWLSEKAPLAAEESRRLISQVLQGLAAAHHAGLVHRDVKPHNVLIAPDGTVKVSDFGIAKTSSGAGMTHTGTVLGTPHYLAPEVVQGEAATAQSDLYAVGVILYEMLSGRLPFEGESAISVAHAHVFEEPPPLADTAPNVSPRMASVVERAMAKSPEDRYASANEMLEELSSASHAESRSAAPGRKGALATTMGMEALGGRAGAAGSRRAPAAGRVASHAPRRPAWQRWALLLPMLLLLGGAGAVLVNAMDPGPDGERALVTVSPTVIRSPSPAGTATETPEPVAGGGLRATRAASTATAEVRAAVGAPTEDPTEPPTSAPPTATGAPSVTDPPATAPSPTATATTPLQPTATPRPPATVTTPPPTATVTPDVAALTSRGMMFRANLSRTGVYQGESVEELEGLKWSFPTGDGVSRSAAVADGKVYFGSIDNYFYAVNAETGKQEWRYRTEGIPSASPAVAGDLVYFGSDDSFLYAVDKDTGKLRWRFQAGGRVPSAPIVADGVVYFGSWDTYMHAVDALSGEDLWRFKTDGRIASSPAIAGGTIYFGSDDTYLYAVDLKTRQQRWRLKTGQRVYSSPAISAGIVYVGSADKYLYAVEAGSGDLRWSFRTNGRVMSSPAVSGATVYVGSDDGFLYAVDATSGGQRWAFNAGRRVFSPPTVAGDTVYFGSDNGSVYAVDARTGELRWEYGTGGPVQSAPAVDGGVVYFGSLDGNLYALQ